MSTSGISAFLSSEEALADWNMLTEFGTRVPEELELQKWFNTWVDKWHGVQKDVVVKYLIKDYVERQKKRAELGPEKYQEWIEGVATLRKQEAYSKMKDDIEKGKKSKESVNTINGSVNM